ncbi:MAG TPA: hypothetical protein VF736_11475 [Pyrinomonadaceae bacterium]|jgi:hypothetical protein
MTPQDHNKVIGIMHLIWGGFNALTMLIMVPFFLVFAGFVRSDPNAPPEVTAIFGLLGGLFVVLALLFGIPPILAGYAMLKRKRWARTAGIVAACCEAISFPFGTALCVYTLWFLFGQGEHFHAAGGAEQDWRRGSLRDAGTYDWQTRQASQAGRPREYTPPPQPPDWRGQ